jgi:hypothetical protein
LLLCAPSGYGVPDADGRRPNFDSKFESHPDRVAEAIAVLKIMQAGDRRNSVDQMR